jgi:hypothetical protein
MLQCNFEYSDINMIQEGISEKAGLVIQYMVTFISGFVVAYTKGKKQWFFSITSEPPDNNGKKRS